MGSGKNGYDFVSGVMNVANLITGDNSWVNQHSFAIFKKSSNGIWLMDWWGVGTSGAATTITGDFDQIDVRYYNNFICTEEAGAPSICVARFNSPGSGAFILIAAANSTSWGYSCSNCIIEPPSTLFPEWV